MNEIINEEKKQNLFKRIFNYYVYSSYTFHGLVFLISLGGTLLTVGLNMNVKYFLIMGIESVLTLSLIIIAFNINYKEIRKMLPEKVISIMTFKNKISDGNRTINTIISSLINIILINIVVYIGLVFKVKFKFLLYLLIVYVFFLFSKIASLDKQMSKFSEKN